MKITQIKAFQIYDSRGLPTIACELIIDDVFVGLAKVPSGASTGIHEAWELRDEDNTQWFGKGVNKAIENINNTIANVLIGFEGDNQQDLDSILIQLDGTNNKSNLGANAILAVSLAYCQACAKAYKLPLFKYLRHHILKNNDDTYYFPTPLVNVVNGGRHSNNTLDFQEFMFVPIGQPTFSKTMQVVSQCFLTLQEMLRYQKISVAKGDEGGFSYNAQNIEVVLDLLTQAIKEAGYEPGKDVCLALDIAASEFYKDGFYYVRSNGLIKQLSTLDMITWYHQLIKKYPIISLEDPFDQNDWEGFSKLNALLGENIQIVGDDLYCTNIKLLKKGIETKATNAILIKLNQIGTLSECLDTIRYANENNIKIIISHRSGETEDDFIADLCLAVSSKQIKTGGISRSERLAKYNRLLYIDHQLSTLQEPSKDIKGH